jgi:hypothetical protein
MPHIFQPIRWSMNAEPEGVGILGDDSAGFSAVAFRLGVKRLPFRRTRGC